MFSKVTMMPFLCVTNSAAPLKECIIKKNSFGKCYKMLLISVQSEFTLFSDINILLKIQGEF